VRRHKSHQSKTQQRQEKPKEASDMCPWHLESSYMHDGLDPLW
jgi:hypothetical protein